MKIKPVTYLLAFTLSILLCLSGEAMAQGIKARMKTRLPVIQSMKTAGIIGENANGYLDFVGSKRSKEDVVAAENTDRSTVYTAIAKREGTTPEVVGTRRAAQLRDLARKGEWLQDRNGKWYQK